MNGSANVFPEGETMIVARRQPVELPELRLEGESELFLPNSLFCSHLLSDGSEELAVASGQQAFTCSTSGKVRLRFNVHFDIKKILFALFNSQDGNKSGGKKLEFLTLVGDEYIEFFSTDDEHGYHYAVPFKVRNVYQCKMGLIVAKDWKNDDEFRITQNDCVYLYSLTHPLNEMLPVIYKVKDSIGEWLFCWENDEITVVEGLNDCLLVFDRVHQVHRLYQIRKTSKHELETCFGLQQRLQVLRHSTPKGAGHVSSSPVVAVGTPRGITPKNVTPAGVEAYPRSVRTRSMLRMTRTRTFPMDSPALSAIGTPITYNYTHHPSPALTPFGASNFARMSLQRSMIFNASTASEFNLTRRLGLEKEWAFDQMYADVCLECIWVEPSSRMKSWTPSTKAFISESMCKQVFINYLSNNNQLMRCIRLLHGESISVASGGPINISCIDAALVETDNLTAVLESESSVALYSGTTKMAVVVLMENDILSPRSIFGSYGNRFYAIENNQFYKINFPDVYEEPLVGSLLKSIVSSLGIEKGLKLMAAWKCRRIRKIPDWPKKPDCPQFHALIRLVLRICGVTIDDSHPYLPKMTDIGCASDDDDESRAKLRRPTSTQEEMWNRLKAFGTEDENQNRVATVSVTVDTTAELYKQLLTVLAVLHSFWEELALDRHRSGLRRNSVHYFFAVSKALSLPALSEVYSTEFPETLKVNYDVSVLGTGTLTGPFVRSTFFDRPICVWTILVDLLKGRINHLLHTYSYKLARFILVFAVGLKRITTAMDLQRLFGKKWATWLNVSKAELVESIVSNKKISAALRCANLIKLFDFTPEEVGKFPIPAAILLGKILVADHDAVDEVFAETPYFALEFQTEAEIMEIGFLRWPTDVRMDNVRAMLASDRPVLIHTHRLDIASGQEERDAQETFLSGTCIRYLGQAFGRSMMNFRTTSVLPTSPLQIPQLCLSARLFPSNNNFEIAMNDAIRPFREWGEFYNGVAAALRLGDTNHVQVDSDWMKSTFTLENKFTQPTTAGLYYGFGLNGHLLKSNVFHTHEMLAMLEDLNSIGLFLGYGAAAIGTCDTMIYRVLTTHLPFLMGPTMLSVSISSLVQTAAMVSLGMLFAESGRVDLIKKFINEIGKAPPIDEPPTQDRYSYRLNAGFGVGLIGLGKGDEICDMEPPFKSPQPTIVERLLILMKGGLRDRCVFPSGPTTDQETQPQVISRHVMEGDCVNTQFTGHPATIALGLMFLRTHNVHIANELKLPNTITGLEEMRPELVMVRTLSRLLVMWDEIELTPEWVESQVPEIVMSYMKSAMKWHDDDDLIVVDSENEYWESIVDRHTLAEVYLYTAAGACFAIALKYSTGNTKQRKMAQSTIDSFLTIVQPNNTRRTHARVAEFAGKNVVSLCFNSLLNSLAMVSVSTGDLSVLRKARLWRMNEPLLTWMRSSRKHQEQLFSHMAIGQLFMGNARFGYKDDNRSIALLVIAFYPISSPSIIDCKHYLQPMRFLWTQAVEPRLLVPISSTQSCPMNCPVKVVLKDNSEPEISSGPTLLPPLEKIKTVEVGGGNYEKIRFNLECENRVAALRKILVRNHGRLKVTASASAVSTDNVAFKMKEIDLDTIFSSNIDEDVSFPSTEEDECAEYKVSFEEIEGISGMKHHLQALQWSIQSMASGSPITSDARLAHAVALWAGETNIVWKLERVISNCRLSEHRL